MARNSDKQKKARERKEKEQKVLLEELESIKSLLTDDALDSNIPVLNERVMEDHLLRPEQEPQAHEHDHKESGASISNSTQALPGQQSLFSDKNSNVKISPDQKSVPTDPSQKPMSKENPFLPEHIRKRLVGNAGMAAFDLPGIMPPIDPKSVMDNPLKNNVNQFELNALNHGALVDELVEEFIPIIKAKLRQKLLEQSTDTTHNKDKDLS